MPNQPTLVNGRSYSWADIVVNILGSVVAGISAISYGDKREKSNIYGAGSEPVARGYGNKTYEGSITLSTEEVEALEKSAPGSDIGKIAPFSIVVAYVPENSTKIKKEVLSYVEFTENKRGWKQNDMTGEVEIPLVIGGINWNA